MEITEFGTNFSLLTRFVYKHTDTRRVQTRVVVLFIFPFTIRAIVKNGLKCTSAQVRHAIHVRCYVICSNSKHKFFAVCL